MAVPPHGYLPYNKTIPAGGETALLFAARVGDLDSARLLVAAGANVNDADAWGVSAVTLAAHSGFTDARRIPARAARRSERGARRLHRAARGDHAPRRDAWWPRCSRTAPTPNAPLQDVDADAPLVGRLQLRAGAGGRDAVLAGRALHPSRASCGCSLKRGADPLFVHHGDRVVEGRGEAFVHRKRRDDGADGGDGHGRRPRLGAAGRGPSAKR